MDATWQCSLTQDINGSYIELLLQADLDVLTDATNGPNPDDYDNAKNPLDDVTLDTPRPAVPEEDDLDIGPSNSEVNLDVNPDEGKSKSDPLDDQVSEDPPETAEPETAEPEVAEPEAAEPEAVEESNPLEEKQVEEEAQAEPSEDPFGAPSSQEEQNPLEEASEGTPSEEVAKEDAGLEVQDKDPVEPLVGDPVSVPVVTGADDDDILTSATDKMEEGDEQYKQMIAESQMDNIFN